MAYLTRHNSETSNLGLASVCLPNLKNLPATKVVAERLGMSLGFFSEELLASFGTNAEALSLWKVKQMLSICHDLGLNPIRKEIYFLPIRGQLTPYVGIDGWFKVLQTSGKLNGVRLTYDRDQKRAFCTLHLKGMEFPIETEFDAPTNSKSPLWKERSDHMSKINALKLAIRIGLGCRTDWDFEEEEPSEMAESKPTVASEKDTIDNFIASVVKFKEAGKTEEQLMAVASRRFKGETLDYVQGQIKKIFQDGSDEDVLTVSEEGEIILE